MARPTYATFDEAIRPPLCAWAPLLSCLLPAITLLAVQADAGWQAAVALGMAFTGAIIITRPIGPRGLRAAIAIGAIAPLAMLGWQTEPAPAQWRQRPPREVHAIIRIEEHFRARRDGHSAGIGRIHSTDLPADDVSGRRAAFYLRSGLADGRPPSIGQLVRIRGRMEYLSFSESLTAANAADADFRSFLQGRGVFLRFNSGLLLEPVAPPSLLEQIRERLQARFARLLAFGPPVESAPGRVLASMLLGDRSLLSEERTALYRNTGTFHLFAVSGLHVGSVALCLFAMAAFTGLPRKLAALGVIAFVWGYVWVTGSSPSAIRAGIMITTICGCRLWHRQSHLFPALVLSAWLVLLVDPGQLALPGFQLSYAVVGAIVLIGLPMAQSLANAYARWRKRRPPPAKWLARSHRAALRTAQTIAISLSASLASMPLIIEYFSLHTPVGFIAGVLLNPLSLACIFVGSAVMLTGLVPLLDPLSAALAHVAWLPIRLMEATLQTLAALPGAFQTRHWRWPATGPVLVAVLLALAWVLQVQRQRGRCQHPAWHALPPAVLLLSLHGLSYGG